MPTNGQKPKTMYDLMDTVAYIVTAPIEDQITYQEPFGWHYDYHTQDKKVEVKVRTELYDEMELPFEKVGSMLLERFNDERLGKKFKYLFVCPVITQNKAYIVDLDTVLQCECREVRRPKSTVDGKKDIMTRLQYYIPLAKWQCVPCDCTKYWDYVSKGADKYNIKLSDYLIKQIENESK